MNKVFITTFFILSFFYGNSQVPTWAKSESLSIYSKFLSKIDTVKLCDGDLEIRLWFNNGANRINTTYFLSLARLRDRWEVSYYTFKSIYRFKDSILVHKQVAVVLNYDSLYNQLIQDGLLTLNNDTLNDFIARKRESKWVWLDGGPTNYSIQSVTDKKRWAVNYKCPRHFYNVEKINEFKIPLKVISALLTIMGMEPC
ncbi:MAG TPA: hypothetical protein VLR49_13225 [Ferruginibacter sp.]|nr:hypothetical protein [Ferruginibacter sp.]